MICGEMPGAHFRASPSNWGSESLVFGSDTDGSDGIPGALPAGVPAASATARANTRRLHRLAETTVVVIRDVVAVGLAVFGKVCRWQVGEGFGNLLEFLHLIKGWRELGRQTECFGIVKQLGLQLGYFGFTGGLKLFNPLTILVM
jgi:hypothetical protein